MNPLKRVLEEAAREAPHQLIPRPNRPPTVGGDGSGWTDVLVRLTMSKQHPVEPEPEREDYKHEN